MGVESLKYESWIELIAKPRGRLYYRDQNSKSMMALRNYVDKYKPNKVIELGTLSGLSLRTWLDSSDDLEVIAVDLSFDSLKKSMVEVPFDINRVTLVEQDILKTNFNNYFCETDKVLLFIDAHDLENVPIMKYMLENVVTFLPKGSVVVVDDLWFSHEVLNDNNVETFFDNEMVYNIDPLQCFDGHYASYWKGGSFFGFKEVVPLLEWINIQKINLIVDESVKSVSFEVDDIRVSNMNNVTSSGMYYYNPVERTSLDLEKQSEIANDVETAAKFFATGYFNKALAIFQSLLERSEPFQGLCYGCALCLIRLNQYKTALKFIQFEKEQFPNSLRIPNIDKDIKEYLDKAKPESNGGIIKALESSMVLFAMPKAFESHIGVIQRNAILSWRELNPDIKIVLCGDDPGVKEFALENKLEHLDGIEKNEFGTPLVNDIFHKVMDKYPADTYVYVNADIILLQDFMEAVRLVSGAFEKYLMIGKRWNSDITFEVDFNGEWQNKIKDFAKANGELFDETGLDYFVFNRETWNEIPPFAIGRTMWDIWLVREALHRAVPVVDSTYSIFAIHQNHNYGHIDGGKKGAWEGPEAKRNWELGDNITTYGFTTNAPWFLYEGNLVCRDYNDLVQARLPKNICDLHMLNHDDDETLENMEKLNSYLQKARFPLAIKICTSMLHNFKAAKQFTEISKTIPLYKATITKVASYLKNGKFDIGYSILKSEIKETKLQNKLIKCVELLD